MIISIDNFKSIAHTDSVDISQLTVLAGVNSSGKSSLIQGLLLLKQTLNSSSNKYLCLEGPYIYANSIIDLIFNKKVGEMRLALELTAEEIKDMEINFYRHDASIQVVKVDVTFKVQTDKCHVSNFIIRIPYNDGYEERFQLKRRPKIGDYELTWNGKTEKKLILDDYSFVNFFPIYAKKDNKIQDFPLVKMTRSSLRQVLEKVVYIAPQRVSPVLARTYQSDVETRFVEPDGQNTRFILDNIAGKNSEISIVKKWLCEEFKLAKDINIIKENGKRYRVEVTTNQGIKVDLMHMGFGLSQILPIITQGCISAPHSLLIVEDPDVHMHPSIQAAMADFFIYLSSKKNVSVLIETHSDHFITRLRRRIAENQICPEQIHLIFVINESGTSVYRTIPLSPKGRPEGFMPPGFLDSLDTDFRAILEANRK